MDLNLKELAGDPSDEAVGAAAVGLMAQAVKAKGPDETQVNALTGFSHQIMSMDRVTPDIIHRNMCCRFDQ